MESFYSENQDFAANAGTMATEMELIEPNLVWQLATPALAKLDQVAVLASPSSAAVGAPIDRYIIRTTSASGNHFSYYRNENAETFRCKDAAASVPAGFTAPVAPAASQVTCTGGVNW